MVDKMGSKISGKVMDSRGVRAAFARRRRVWGSKAAVGVLVVFLCGSGWAALTPQHRSLLEWLTNRPPIAEAVLELSGFYLMNLGHSGPPPKGVIHVRMSLQPDTFFVYTDTHPLLKRPEWVGESRQWYWSLCPGVLCLAPKKGPGADPENYAQSYAESDRKWAGRLLQFGAEEFYELKFLDAIHFVGKDRSNPDYAIPLRGQLLLDEQGIPIGTKFGGERIVKYGGKRRKWYIQCVSRFVGWKKFDGGQWLLPEMVVYEKKFRIYDLEKEKDWTFTNRVVKIKTGLLPKDVEYVPSQFIDTNHPPPKLSIDSNRVSYLVTKAGWVRFEGQEPPPLARKASRSARAFLWVVGGGSMAVLFFWFLMVLSRKAKEGENQR